MSRAFLQQNFTIFLSDLIDYNIEYTPRLIGAPNTLGLFINISEFTLAHEIFRS